MNITEKIEARIKAFLNKPIPPISFKHFVLLITSLLAVGSIAGLFRPFVAWGFILTFFGLAITFVLAFLIPYYAQKEEST